MFSEESYGLERNNKVLLIDTNKHACPKMQAIKKWIPIFTLVNQQKIHKHEAWSSRETICIIKRKYFVNHSFSKWMVPEMKLREASGLLGKQY